jgi:hypothetical protein
LLALKAEQALALEIDLALPEVQASAVGVEVGVIVGVGVIVAVGVTVGVRVAVAVGQPVGVGQLVGVGEAVGVGVFVWVRVAVGVREPVGVNVRLIPGIIKSPSSTLKPPDAESTRLVAMVFIWGPKAINEPATTRPTRAARSAYSTSPCPFLFFLFKKLWFIFSPIEKTGKQIRLLFFNPPAQLQDKFSSETFPERRSITLNEA